MSNTRKARRHPGSDPVTVAYIAEEAWQAAGEPDDVTGWLDTLGVEGINEVMLEVEVTRDEFLRRMAGHPDVARQASTAQDLLVMLMDLDGLRPWWDSEPGRTSP